MKLRNANLAAKVTGQDELAGTSNYFIGNDPAKWRTNVPTYAKVKYEGIYPGIDLVYYGNQRQLEYDFVVAPGADPHRIAFDVRGAKRIRRDAHGDLVLTMKMGEDEIRWHKPVVYQEKNGARQEIAARYAITEKNRVGFELAKYDASKPLYIDPLIYSTYLGGSGDDEGFSIAVDSAGNAYVTGITSSTDFPTMNPMQPTNHGNADGDCFCDAFVAKINAAGSALVYSTYLGGSGYDSGWGIAVDSAGNAYVTGYTASTDFPTKNPLQAAQGGYGDAFVAKLSATGTALVYSTYLGGSFAEYGHHIAVDSAGNAYVTGDTGSTDFPTTTNAVQPVYGGPNSDAFVSKLNPTGSALVYSTYLGGSGEDYGYDIALDSAGNAYVTGPTNSTDFPTKNPLQGANAGSWDAFVAKINAAGSALVYSTYLGGRSEDGGERIAVDSGGQTYVTGYTYSIDFPTKNPLQGANAGGEDGFVAKINATGSGLVYSTYLGGSGREGGYGIAADSAGNAYVTGSTTSTDFPTTINAVQSANAGSWDAFVAKINAVGSALLYSSYLGGSGDDFGGGFAVDSSRNPYVTGQTSSTNFPTMNPLQSTYGGGGSDAFLAKTSVPAETPTTTTLSSSPNPSTYGQAVTFTAVVTSSIGAPPDGEPVTFIEGTTTLGTGVLSGGSASFTTSALALLAGTHSIRAVYGGDSKFLNSKSSAVSQVVGKATSTTTLTSSRNPSSFGQWVTFTARVAPQFSGTPSGMVTFLNGATVLATKALSAGTAIFSTSKLPLGSNMITAVYGGDSNFASSTSAPVNQVVLTATTTTLSSSLNPSTYGQAVTFTAAVTSILGAPPDGETVKFMKGATVLGTGALSGGSASFTTSALPAGTNYIKAVYGGDANFAASTSKAVSQIVSKATTTATLTSSLNPSSFGQSVTFTASVTPQYSGTVKGTVTFYDGTTALKTVGLSGGVAKYTTSILTSGSHSITATYNGNNNFDGSSASLTQTVN
jgi:Bacterial Ig-like domain (group 3)/Beta-propeller repeat